MAEVAEDIKQLGDKIVGLTLKQAVDLAGYLKDTYQIEPAAVAFPSSVEQARDAILAATDANISVSPRGAVAGARIFLERREQRSGLIGRIMCSDEVVRLLAHAADRVTRRTLAQPRLRKDPGSPRGEACSSPAAAPPGGDATARGMAFRSAAGSGSSKRRSGNARQPSSMNCRTAATPTAGSDSAGSAQTTSSVTSGSIRAESCEFHAWR